MAKKKSNSRGFLQYNVRNFIVGITFLTIINFILAFAMHRAFGLVGVTGIFFLVENIFFNTLFVNQNTKNIIYLKKEIDKMKRKKKTPVKDK